MERVYQWVFKGMVLMLSVLFALLIVVAGALILNRAVFDGFSAAGYFCKGTIDLKDPREEITGTTRADFTTDQMCWPTGLKLKEGRRYRITLTTPGDWFDRTHRADVAGFPSDSAGSPRDRFIFWIFTPLKRWWGQNWFKPIARIGVLGNDEYVLDPSDPFDRYCYPQCLEVTRETEGSGGRAKIKKEVAQQLLNCAPTPNDRKSVVTEIKARTTGELFLYVNDAVLMLPGKSDLFVSNNTGTASVSVERVLSQANAN